VQTVKEWEIYPNPTYGILTIETTDMNSKSTRVVEVSDMSGKIILKHPLFAAKSLINLSHLENGVYLVTQFIDKKRGEPKKVIIHH
jgi:Secretion system C-terminal sorting domain